MGPCIPHKRCTSDRPGHTHCTASVGRAGDMGSLDMLSGL